jgi:SAM-dependent methyltransferase
VFAVVWRLRQDTRGTKFDLLSGPPACAWQAELVTNDGRSYHWDGVYQRIGSDAVSWFQREPTLSLSLLEAAGLTADSSVIDVGGGASPLVDRLLDHGVDDVSVLDLSATALKVSQNRLGERASHVHWLERDLLTWRPGRRFDLWHDRAVFHFLTDAADRDTYRRTLDTALAADGHAVIATFADDGPEYCSGLAVARYSPDALAAEFRFLKVTRAERELHHTPSGVLQPFTWLTLSR